MDPERQPFLLLKELELLGDGQSRVLNFERKVKVLVPPKLFAVAM